MNYEGDSFKRNLYKENVTVYLTQTKKYNDFHESVNFTFLY